MKETTVELMEERLVDVLNTAGNIEEGSDLRANINFEAFTLIDKLNEVERLNLEYLDKEERRKLDEKRNDTTLQIEREKQNVNWKRGLIEGAKIAGPIIIVLMQIIASSKFQERVLEYEKDGTIRTTVGRSFGLPRIFKQV